MSRDTLKVCIKVFRSKLGNKSLLLHQEEYLVSVDYFGRGSLVSSVGNGKDLSKFNDCFFICYETCELQYLHEKNLYSK